MPIAGDIRKLSYNRSTQELIYDGQTIYRGTIDAICGGFPCQDISVAGNQKGITAERSGLWSELHRLISEIRPRYAIIENVTALVSGSGEYEQQIDRCLCGWPYRWRRVLICEQGENEERNANIYSKNRYWNGEKSKSYFGETTQAIRRVINDDQESNGKMGRSVEMGINWGESKDALSGIDTTSAVKERTSNPSIKTESERRGSNKTINFRIEPEGAEHDNRGRVCCPSCGREVANSSERFGQFTWFGRVLGDLAEIRYDTEWHCIPASELGAHHHRDRVWIICYPEHTGRTSAEVREGDQEGNGSNQKGQKPTSEPQRSSDAEILASAEKLQRDECNIDRENSKSQIQESGSTDRKNDISDTMQPGPQGRAQPRIFRDGRERWHKLIAGRFCDFQEISEIEPTICGGVNGVSDYAHRLKGLGNAVVPQIPELLGRAIINYEESK